ncbi:hypothetical protein BKA63DRAFT_568003 [Paraphoma chrysanthemicola]|nr:hypothetical protein BKA63DRAFT_568003 [Paraphoma chrysanthemicola]
MVLLAVYLFVLFALQAWCQTVQDDWVAPAAPDESTSLQSGFPFTLMWKTTLQNNFKTYCPSCDVRQLDLWVTSFNGKKYKYKIGVATSSVISSSSVPASLSIGTSSSTSSNLSPSSTVANTSPQPNGASNSKTWLAGVVIGPIAGIALGAALTWFLLRRRKKNKRTQHRPVDGYNQNFQQNDDKYSYQAQEQVKPTVLHEGMREQQQWQSQGSFNDQCPVEAPDGAPPPAELWQEIIAHELGENLDIQEDDQIAQNLCWEATSNNSM